MTMQLDTWRGAFGAEYTNRQEDNLDARRDMWREIGVNPDNMLEVGANKGLNLLAYPYSANLFGLEPNAEAREEMRNADINIVRGSAAKISAKPGAFNLVFTCGVLIHIPPAELFKSCSEIVRVSNRFVLAIEYFSAEPEMKNYQGRNGMMWKRDFGKFYLDNFDLRVVDHGFFWKETSGLDNLTWTLMEKSS